MPDQTRFAVDIYRDFRHPGRFLTVSQGAIPREIVPTDVGVQLLDFMLFEVNVPLGHVRGLRFDADRVRHDLQHSGYSLHQGLAAVTKIDAAPAPSSSEPDSLRRRAQVLLVRARGWRDLIDSQGEQWDGYCHTLAAALALEERAAGLLARAEAGQRFEWAA